MTAPMKFDRSAMSPIGSDAVCSSNSAPMTFHTERGTKARDAAEHFWPWYSNAPRISAVRSAAGSAEGCASTKSLPPVSPTRRG